MGLIVLGNYILESILDGLDFEITPVNEPTVHRIIMTSMVAYIFLMALPFVPGAEIGFGVMMLLGPKIVPLVYLSTITSLFLSFLIGKLIPEKMLIKFLHDIHLTKTSLFLAEIEGLDLDQRFNLLLERSPKKLASAVSSKS